MPVESPAILFVDDDTANLKVLEVHLRNDFNVLTAQNGTDALALLESGKHDIALVVADQRMAGMTGAELLTIVRARFEDVGRMLITAFADLNPIIQAINEGQISGYVRKPWNPTELRMLLRNGLDRVLLERRLRQAEMELLAAERDAVIGFVAAGVGHELNQPASVLRMNLETLRAGMTDAAGGGARADAADEAKAVLDDCMRAVDELAVLSADLRVLALFRQTNKRGTVASLNACAERAVRFAEAYLRPIADVTVELSEIPEARAEESGLTQVLVSLFAHALGALEPEEPTRRFKVAVRTRMEEGHVVFSLSDDGPGMPPDVLAKVFNPLAIEAGDAPSFRMGLSYSSKLAASWGGVLQVHSELDVGSVYELRLLPSRAQLKVVPDDAGAQETGTRVLVVDDEPSVLRAVKRILRDGYEVDVVDNGREALALLGSREYRAVLCDLQMPRPDGVEIYDHLAESKPEMLARLAFMTGGALSSRITSFLTRVERAGMPVLDKPFDHRLVRQLVRDLIAK